MDNPLEPATHQAIEPRLCGEPRELREGYCRVEMTTGDEMRADEAHALECDAIGHRMINRCAIRLEAMGECIHAGSSRQARR